MKELITYIAKALVDNPDQVEVAEVEGKSTSVLWKYQCRTAGTR